MARPARFCCSKTTGGDCGRCCAGNISDAYPGAELWGGGYGYGASDLETEVGHFGTAENFTIYWDGDLLKEICDHRGFSTATGYGFGSITKFITHGNIQTLLSASAISCNYTKGTPCLQADILGDWREEVIWHTTDEEYFYIYTTPYPTEYRFYTLMHDPQYRQAICWQMCGYNQPPHPSFFLGEAEGMILPPPPAATNGKLVWTGADTEWNRTSKTAFLYDSVATAFSDGKQVLFDVSAASTSLKLSGDLAPEVLTVNSPEDYTIDGTSGSIIGTGRINKMGEGTFFLSGDHTFTGPVEIWAGTLTLDGSLVSDVDMKHFAVLNANSSLGGNVCMAYAAELYIGAKNQADTLTIKDTLRMTKGAILEIDLSQYPSDTTASAGLNDYLKVACLVMEEGAVIQLNQTNDNLGIGRYDLLEASDSLMFDLDAIR
jgi:autotransporter-associated beta strand repeat